MHTGYGAAAVGLQPAATVVDRHAGHPDDQGVGEPRRDHAQPAPFLSVDASPGDGLEVVGTQRGEQTWDIRRIVLSVAVECDDHVAAGLMQPSAQSRRLAEVAVQIDHAQRRDGFAQRLQALMRGIAASVVDEEDFRRLAEALYDGVDLPHQRRDVVLLVEHRHDDRKARRWLHVDRLHTANGAASNYPRDGAAAAATARAGRAALPKKDSTPATTRSTSASVRSGKTGSERISAASRPARGKCPPSPNARAHAGWRCSGTG